MHLNMLENHQFRSIFNKIIANHKLSNSIKHKYQPVYVQAHDERDRAFLLNTALNVHTFSIYRFSVPPVGFSITVIIITARDWKE